MKAPLPGESTPPPIIPPLALRPADAALALGISERTLWGWTESGLVRCVRIGGVKTYAVKDLEAFLDANATPAKADGPEGGAA